MRQDCPIILDIMKKKRLLNAFAGYRECLENRILCLCLRYGQEVSFIDILPDGKPITMNYENAIIFKNIKKIGPHRNVIGLCYSPKNDKEWNGKSINKLENYFHPGLEYICSKQWLAGDEAEKLSVFDIFELETILNWIKEEITTYQQ